MARVQNTLIGKASGSVGGATFSTWKGINVLKSKAEIVANPQTDAQMSQRQKMSLLVAIFRLVSLVIDKGFQALAVKKSAYNAFISENLKVDNFTGTYPSQLINYWNLKISKGTIGTTDIATAVGTAASKDVVITWDENDVPVGSNADDIAVSAVYNKTQDIWAFGSDVARSVGTVTVSLAENVASEDELFMYLFFKEATGNEVSTSKSSGQTV